MPVLKLGIVASIYGKTPHKIDKLVRSIATTTTAASSAILTSRRPQASCLWRITPCAPLAHDKVLLYSANCRKLGLIRSQKSFNSFGEKGGVLGGVESFSINNNSMGSENKDDQWLENEPSPTSTLPSHNHTNNLRLKSSPLQSKTPPSPPPLLSSPQNQSDKLLTLPTILTIGRVAAVPLLVSTFYLNSWWGTTATTSIFIVAAITDWLDGYLARKMNLGSAFGAFLDPVADKLMVAATLVLLCTRPPEVSMFGQVPWLLTVPAIAIIGREITMSAVREWAASQNSKLSEAVAVNNLGKWKTAAQMTALTILLVTRDSSFTEAGILVSSGVVLLYISAWLAVWSLYVYMKKIWKVLLM